MKFTLVILLAVLLFGCAASTPKVSDPVAAVKVTQGKLEQSSRTSDGIIKSLNKSIERAEKHLDELPQ